jgi:DNA primase
VKYYTAPGLQKSKLLFNADKAKAFNFAVLVEGVFDVFRVGPQAVAPLGTSLSMIQRRLIHTYWGSGAFIIMLDSDAGEEMRKLQEGFSPSSFRLGLFTVTLPAQYDPADMTTAEVWELLCKQVEGLQQGREKSLRG